MGLSLSQLKLLPLGHMNQIDAYHGTLVIANGY